MTYVVSDIHAQYALFMRLLDYIKFSDGGGQLTVVNSSNGDSATKTYYPIGSAAYDEVRIKSISFSLDKSKKDEKGNIIGQVVITCSLSITADGKDILWEKSVDVVPLYQITTA